MRKKQFYKLAAEIEKHPHEYRQSMWFHYKTVKDDCGTVACLAGRAAVLNGYIPIRHNVFYLPISCCRDPKTGQVSEIADVARRLLGISKKDAGRLFNSDAVGWRNEIAFRAARSEEGQAAVAVKELRDLVELGSYAKRYRKPRSVRIAAEERPNVRLLEGHGVEATQVQPGGSELRASKRRRAHLRRVHALLHSAVRQVACVRNT